MWQATTRSANHCADGVASLGANDPAKSPYAWVRCSLSCTGCHVISPPIHRPSEGVLATRPPKRVVYSTLGRTGHNQPGAVVAHRGTFWAVPSAISAISVTARFPVLSSVFAVAAVAAVAVAAVAGTVSGCRGLLAGERRLAGRARPPEPAKRDFTAVDAFTIAARPPRMRAGGLDA